MSTYRKEWECCGSVTETEAWEPERCPFCSTDKDAERYRHMRGTAVFQDRNGPGLYWYLPRWDRGLPIGERLDRAIDAAMLKTPNTGIQRPADGSPAAGTLE